MSSLFAPKGGKGLKFQTPGTSYTGKVTSEPVEQQQTEYGSDRPATWPSGEPKMQILVNLETQLQEEPDDDGRRTLYVTSPKMKRAIFDAISNAGADDLKVGGMLTITFTGTDPNSKNPANPAKLYTASYVPPAPGTGSTFAPAAAPAQQAATAPQPPYQAAPVEQVDPWNPPAAAAVQQPYQAAPVAAPAAAPAQAPAPAGDPSIYDKVKQLINVGLDDQAITNATNIPVEQVAAIRAA